MIFVFDVKKQVNKNTQKKKQLSTLIIKKLVIKNNNIKEKNNIKFN